MAKNKLKNKFITKKIESTNLQLSQNTKNTVKDLRKTLYISVVILTIQTVIFAFSNRL
jgi:hypothetical protein